MRRLLPLVLSLTFASPILAQRAFDPEIEPASDAAARALKTIQPAAGMVVELIAAEPQLANPVAFDIDVHGRFYIAETFRLRRGVFDTRDHADWVDGDLAARTVADRVALMRAKLENIEDYEVAHERIRLLQDTDGDGELESVVFADGFRDLAQGIASGVLAHGGDVWFTCIPQLWRLRDTDADGRADERTAVHDGFGVRFNLIGHDLHGLRVGPDRRLYFSIGDRGFSVQTPEGLLDYPDTGAVLRCELDGSKLEVFASGLRNPQELAFDDHGNLFTGDNNSDGGDRARWVYVVEGGDSGWRVGYQWLGDRGPWNREKLWHPHHHGQPAWIVPPVANALHGPAGLTHYPGTGLPARYADHFFICDFRASPAVSGIYASHFVPKGAGFELGSEEKFAWGMCATDVEVGFDGGVYLTDWVSGWGQPLRGRIYRVHDPKVSASPEVAATRRVLREGMEGRDIPALCGLLGHRDQRVRLAAQFELVDRDAHAALAEIALGPDRRLARLHAIWAIGVLGRRDAARCKAIAALLDAGDAEIVAQTAKVIGDAKFDGVTAKLIARLTHRNSRVRFFAAEALGKLGAAKAVAPLLDLLRDVADRDPWLRHAAIFALASIGDAGALRDAAADASPAVRRGVLLALARLRSGDCATFLYDRDAEVALEAARAVYRHAHELPAAAERALAARITRPEPMGDALGRRVLGANRRLATADAAHALARFAARDDVEAAQREDALEILAEWHDPSIRDRVIGGFRPVAAADAPDVDRGAGDRELAATLPQILREARGDVAATAARIAGQREIAAAGPRLTALAKDRGRAATARAAAFEALDALRGEAAPSEELRTLLGAISGEDPVPVRLIGSRLLAKLDPDTAVPILAGLCENATMPERQNAMLALGESTSAAADAVLVEWLSRLQNGDVPDDMQLEVIEAGTARQAVEVAAALTRYQESLPRGDLLARFHASIAGGDRGKGRKIFFEHPTAQCLRCHQVGVQGGAAGPPLDGIAKLLEPDALLESLVNPNAKIAEGFAMAIVTLEDGSVQVGVIGRETDAEIELVDATAKRHTIAKADIRSRTTQQASAMPPMAGILTPRELRDVMAYLQSLSKSK